MSTPELSRLIRPRPLPGGKVRIDADDAERAALARRFGIVRIDRLVAIVALTEDDTAITATGSLDADLVQLCAISGEDFPVALHEPLLLRFVPGQDTPAEFDLEIELDGDALDEIEYHGEMFDLGEAVAQTLALAIDPYAEGPNADAARRAAGIVLEGEQDGPLAALLAGLQKN